MAIWILFFFYCPLDEGVTLEMLDGLKERKQKDLGYGYEVGDMVWEKIESHL